MFESIRIGAAGAGKGKNEAAGAVVIVGMFQGEKSAPGAGAWDADGAVAAAASRPEATGEAGRIVEAFAGAGRAGKAPGRVLIVGLGKKDGFTAAGLRNVAASVARRLAQTKDTRASVELTGALDGTRVEPALAGRCFAEGVGLLGWTYDTFRGKGTEPVKRTDLTLTASDKAFEDGMRLGLRLAESTNFARDLSQAPPNVATPMWVAERARTLAKKVGLACRVINGQPLKRERMEGLINVGKASENEPCLIRLEYRPARAAKGTKPVVLVGKTMTYDTGGLSLKINNGMVGMKRDKDGGCAVLGAMHAVATAIKPSFPVVALLASAENSISDEAYRPDDVITFRNGVTAEITNTDAEGRLVLADALCWACELENPACIVDLATLTGGVITALGSTFAGLFCEHDGLRARLERASADSGERIWRLPMHQEYRDMMKSPIADIINSNPNRKAHPIQGAAFLSYFVKEGVPWAHLDIAGVHALEADSGPFIKGPTGWGVRLLADLLSQEDLPSIAAAAKAGAPQGRKRSKGPAPAASRNGAHAGTANGQPQETGGEEKNLAPATRGRSGTRVGP